MECGSIFRRVPTREPESTVSPGFGKRPALMQVSTQGGETAEIPLGLTDSLVFDISPTRPELLVGGPASKKGTPFRRELWILPLPTGPLRRVGNILALDASWSPDGNHVVFVDGNDISVANPDGSEIRKLATHPTLPTGSGFRRMERGCASLCSL